MRAALAFLLPLHDVSGSTRGPGSQSERFSAASGRLVLEAGQGSQFLDWGISMDVVWALSRPTDLSFLAAGPFGRAGSDSATTDLRCVFEVLNGSDETWGESNFELKFIEAHPD